MGDSSMVSKQQHKPEQDYRLPFSGLYRGLPVDFLKRLGKMAEAKMMLLIANILGIPLVGYTIFLNIGTWQGTLLILLSSLFLVVKIVFYCIMKWQEVKSKNLSLRREEYETEKEINEEY